MRRLAASRVLQLEKDALALVHKVGAASARGLTDVAAARLEDKLQQFARGARQVLNGGTLTSEPSGGGGATEDANPDVRELRRELAALRHDMSRVLTAMERMEERQKKGK